MRRAVPIISAAWLCLLGSLHPSAAAPSKVLSPQIQAKRTLAKLSRDSLKADVGKLLKPGETLPGTRFELSLKAVEVARRAYVEQHPEEAALFESLGQHARTSFLKQWKARHDERATAKATKLAARELRLAPERDVFSQPRLSNPEMRAFSELVRSISKGKRLRGFRLVGIQHLLGSTGGLVRGLAASGLKPEDTLLIGKTYSQVEDVARDLEADGFGTVLSQHEPDNSTRFGQGNHNRMVELRHALDDIAGRPVYGRPSSRPAHKGRFLVLDDGGELIELIHKEYPELHDRVVAVEQTTRGVRRIEKLGLKFPVVTVGNEPQKLTYESPMIGRSLALTGHARLERIRAQGFAVGKEILLLGGAGAVGRATARAYKALGYTVRIFDKRDAEAQRVAAEDGLIYEASLDEALKRSHVVLSATGTETIGPREQALLPHGAILMNGASSATEITPAQLPEQKGLVEFVGPKSSKVAQLRMKDTLDEAYDRQVREFMGRSFDIGGVRPMFGKRHGHDQIIRLDSGKELLLLNQGQVINFDGKPDPIPPRYIQLTRGLLFLAALQAAGAKGAGPQHLDPHVAKTYRESVEQDLASQGESLLAPTF